MAVLRHGLHCQRSSGGSEPWPATGCILRGEGLSMFSVTVLSHCWFRQRCFVGLVP